MDKETLSNYGWIVVCVMVLAVLLALASPFGTFVAGAIKSTTAGLFSVNQAALGSAGIDVNDMVFENCDHLETEIRNATDTYTGDTCCKACGAVLQAGQTVKAKVPEGGKYTAADGTVYNPGDEMPETVTTGDTYEYHRYIYKYNQRLKSSNTWETVESQNGWGVGRKSIGGVRDWGEMLSSINGKSIVSVRYTYHSCSDMTVTPKIPETVTDMYGAFYCCDKITAAPIIPENVTNMQQTFQGCKLLTTAPTIPSGVTNLYLTFGGCSSLKTYVGSSDVDGDFSNYKLPANLSNATYLFSGCKEMVVAPTIPSNLTDISGMFNGCSKLIVAPVLPENTTRMDWTFTDCSSLTTAPIIPSNATWLYQTFNGCTSLITYHGSTDTDGDFSNYILPNKSSLYATFQNCKSLIISPVIPSGCDTITQAFYGCTSLTTITGAIPEKVYYMSWAFRDCTSLTGVITINAKLGNSQYSDCFKGVDFASQELMLSGSCTLLDTK